MDHGRSSLWMPSDLFKLSLQGGCSGGYPLSAPSERQKHTSVGLPTTVNQANIPSCLLPPAPHSLLTSHIWTQLFCFFLGNKNARQQWTEGEKRDTYQRPPFFFSPITALLPSKHGKTSSEVCLDPNIYAVLTEGGRSGKRSRE